MKTGFSLLIFVVLSCIAPITFANHSVFPSGTYEQVRILKNWTEEPVDISFKTMFNQYKDKPKENPGGIFWGLEITDGQLKSSVVSYRDSIFSFGSASVSLDEVSIMNRVIGEELTEKDFANLRPSISLSEEEVALKVESTDGSINFFIFRPVEKNILEGRFEQFLDLSN